jgi:hypothetical protein
MRHAGVEAGADNKTIVVTEQLIRICRLQGKPAGVRRGVCSIVFSQDRIRGERIGKLLPVKTVRGCDAITEAEQRGVGRTGLRSRRIAVLSLLGESPVVGDPFDRPGWRSL